MNTFFLTQILALPYLQAIRIGAMFPSMEDGFCEIIGYVYQFLKIANQLHLFLMEYIWNYWFLTMGPERVTVYDIRK